MAPSTSHHSTLSSQVSLLRMTPGTPNRSQSTTERRTPASSPSSACHVFPVTPPAPLSLGSRRRQPDGGAEDLGEATSREASDHHPRRIELEPAHAELRRARMGVMVVVQA